MKRSLNEVQRICQKATEGAGAPAGLDTDAANIAKARDHIRALGLYGQVSVERWTGELLPYADNLVNLVVAEDLGTVGEAQAARACLEQHGAEIVVADFESEVVEGDPGHVTVVLKFASKDAARDWFDSPEYQAIIGLRTDNSTGIAVLANAAGG